MVGKIKNLIFFFLFQLLNSKLLFFFEIFRHGARSPVYLKNKTDLFDQKWDINKGELTPVGERQHFLLGYEVKKQLVEQKLISEIYYPPDILIMSTNYNRTLMSGYSHLRGFYSFSANLSENQSINARAPNKFNDDSILTRLDKSPLLMSIQPVPIVQIMDDDSLNLLKLCNLKSEYEQNKILLKNEVDAMISELGKIKDTLKIKEDVFTRRNYSELALYCDSYLALEADGRLKIPNFLGIQSQEKLTEIQITMKKCAELEAKLHDNNKMKSKVIKTPLFKKIVELMEDAIYNPDNVKVFLFSGHDSNINLFNIFLQNSLQISHEIHFIPFASNFIVELHSDSNNKYWVKIKYNGDNVVDRLSFSEFKDKVNQYIASSDEINKYCNWTDDISSEKLFLNYILLVLVIIVIYFNFNVNRKICEIKSKLNIRENEFASHT